MRINEIRDAPVASRCHLRHGRVAIKPQEAHRGRQNAGPLILRFVQKLAGGLRDNGVRPRLSIVAQMVRGHHDPEGLFKRAVRIGQKARNLRECLFLFGVENMQDGADQKGVAGLFPVGAPLQGAFRIDQNVRDVLDVANLVRAFANLQKRIVFGAAGVGGVEQKTMREFRAPPRCELPVLTLDVVDDGALSPTQ